HVVLRHVEAEHTLVDLAAQQIRADRSLDRDGAETAGRAREHRPVRGLQAPIAIDADLDADLIGIAAGRFARRSDAAQGLVARRPNAGRARSRLRVGCGAEAMRSAGAPTGSSTGCCAKMAKLVGAISGRASA